MTGIWEGHGYCSLPCQRQGYPSQALLVKSQCSLHHSRQWHHQGQLTSCVTSCWTVGECATEEASFSRRPTDPLSGKNLGLDIMPIDRPSYATSEGLDTFPSKRISLTRGTAEQTFHGRPKFVCSHGGSLCWIYYRTMTILDSLFSVASQIQAWTYPMAISVFL